MLAICALVLFGLVKLDAAAADSAARRARETLAEQAKASNSRPEKPAPIAHRASEDSSIGERGPIVLPVGSAWSGGTASAVAHADYTRAPGASGALSRTVRPEPSSTPVLPQAPQVLGGIIPSASAAAVAQRPGDEPGPPAALLALFAGCGIMMSLAGAALLIRIPR